MLKKRVLKRLLPLLFSFCFVFSGFLSVNAFAYTSYDNFPFNETLYLNYWSNGSMVGSISSNLDNSNNTYTFSNNSITTSLLQFLTGGTPFVFPVNVDVFDYYLLGSVYSPAVNISNFTFFPNSMTVSAYTHSNSEVVMPISDVNYYHLDTAKYKGFSFSCKLDLSTYNGISQFHFLSSSGTLPANLISEFSVIALPKGTGSGDANQAIVNAINNQTNQLSSDIGQAADDVQQSIEDQYSGDPETEFSVDDVITQHNEKMGVLSFGSDVMLQFLDMFQSANVGTAELTLPGFNITVENVEYAVWPDYSFNFEQLNEWVPALMSVIRVMLPAFVWLMVLRYCIKVFEDNFLAK